LLVALAVAVDFIAVVHSLVAVAVQADMPQVQFQFQQVFLIRSQLVVVVLVVQQAQGLKEVQKAVTRYLHLLEQPCKAVAVAVA
jgi:membrane protein implicated in regulation of membrane protease activity